MESKDVDRMIELYKSGKSAREAAAAFGMHTSSAYYHLKLRGVKRRAQPESSRLGHGGTLNEHAFDEITPESAYWLGFCLADAGVSNNDEQRRWSLKLELAVCDTGHIEKFKSFMGASNKIGFAEKTAGVYIRINSKYLINTVAKYGLVPNKTPTAAVPECLQNNRDFFRGLLDGDACLFADARGLRRISLVGTYAVVEAFKNFSAQFVDSKTTIRKDRNIFVYDLNGKNASTMMEILYQDHDVYYLDRKRAKAYELTGRTIPN
jgi:hypothetical protein